MTKQQGFTLIEVMVALLVVAVALSALSQTLAMFVNQQASLPERTYAGWIAQNRLTELQHSVGDEVELKTKITLGAQDWQTEISLEPTPIPGMMRATVEVRLEGSEHLANRMVTVVGN